MEPTLRMYGELAPWWPLLFPPADLAREYDLLVYVDSTRATQPNHPDR